MKRRSSLYARPDIVRREQCAGRSLTTSKRSSDAGGRGLRPRGCPSHRGDRPGTNDDTAAEAPSTKLVETIAAHTGAFGMRLSTELRTGHPAQEILAAARTHQADLIVLGHSGRSGTWGRFLGTTAER